MSTTSEKQSQADQTEAAAPGKPSGQKSIMALAIFALGINTAAAVFTLSPSPSDFTLPDISKLAELLPLPKASDPTPDPAVAALKDIESAQQQHVAALQENNILLQQNTALLQQDSIALASLRQSVVDEQAGMKKLSSQIADGHEDVKKISAQLSKLMAKVDSLQNAMIPEVTSSISARNAQNRLSRAARKKMVRQPQPVGPVSLGGAPLSFPATTVAPQS